MSHRRRAARRRVWVVLAAAIAVGITTFTFGPSPATAASSPFSIVVIPDTQRYLEEGPPDQSQFFIDQIDWIVDNAAARDIAFVSHVGDIVQNSQNQNEWSIAGPQLDRLDDSGLPWGCRRGTTTCSTTAPRRHTTNGSQRRGSRASPGTAATSTAT